MTKLISADEIGQAWGHINSDWPDGRFQELKRYVKDTLHDAQAAVEAFEDAARQRTKESDGSKRTFAPNRAEIKAVPSPSPEPVTGTFSASGDHAKALHKLAAAVFCPPADDEADQRARKAGIGA